MTTQHTSITALPYPDLNSAPNVPGDMQALATALDTITVPRFASVAARNAITPVIGMFCVTTDTNYLWRYNGTKWLRQLTDICVTADMPYTNTAAPAPITSANTLPAGGFTFPADINSRYEWELEAHIIGQTSVGIAPTLNQPANCRSDWMGFGLNSAGAAFNGGAQNITLTVFTMGTFTSSYFRMVGTTLTTSTAGSVALTFCQGTANAATSWVLIGTKWQHLQVS